MTYPWGLVTKFDFGEGDLDEGSDDYFYYNSPFFNVKYNFTSFKHPPLSFYSLQTKFLFVVRSPVSDLLSLNPCVRSPTSMFVCPNLCVKFPVSELLCWTFCVSGLLNIQFFLNISPASRSDVDSYSETPFLVSSPKTGSRLY